MIRPSWRTLLSFFPLCLTLAAAPLLAETAVGVLMPLSGDFARYGAIVRGGITSVPSPQLKLIFEDDGCLPASALRAYKKLLTFDGARIFIGPGCGSPQIVIAEKLKTDDAVALLTNSAPRRVFELSGGRMLSVQSSIEQESIFNAEKLYERGVRKVVLLFSENDFSRAHEAAFKGAFKGEVLDTLVYSSQSDDSMRALAHSVRRLAPDALYVPDAAPFLHGLSRRLAESGSSALPLYSVYSSHSEDVRKAVQGWKGPLFYSYPKIEGDALEVFPALATKMLVRAIASCPEATATSSCVLAALRSQNRFDEFGVLAGEIELRALSEE